MCNRKLSSDAEIVRELTKEPSLIERLEEVLSEALQEEHNEAMGVIESALEDYDFVVRTR